MEPKKIERTHGLLRMLSSENTTQPADDEIEVCRPSFQTPLHLKVGSTAFLGNPKPPDVSNQVREDGLVLSTWFPQSWPANAAEQPTVQMLADGSSESATPNCETSVIIDDDDLSWTTDSTVNELVEAIAKMECQRDESIRGDHSDSEWPEETDSDAEGWILSKVTRRRHQSSATSDQESQESRLPAEGSSDLTAAADRDTSPTREAKHLIGDNVKVDGVTRMDFAHGDFQTENRDPLDPETEGAVDPEPQGVDARLKAAVYAWIKATADTVLEKSVDIKVEAAVDVWIEEAKIEAEILKKNMGRSFSCGQEYSEVPSDVSESGHESNLEGMYTADLLSSEISSTDIHTSISLERKLEEEKHSGIDLAEMNYTEEKFSDVINSEETSLPEIDSTQINGPDLETAEIVSASMKLPEICLKFADIISDQNQNLRPCNEQTNYDSISADGTYGYKLTLPGTVEMKTVETQTTNFDIPDSRPASIKRSDSEISVPDCSSSSSEKNQSYHNSEKSNSFNKCFVKMESADSDTDVESEFDGSHLVDADFVGKSAVAEDIREEQRSAYCRNPLIILLRCTLGSWMHFWGPMYFS